MIERVAAEQEAAGYGDDLALAQRMADVADHITMRYFTGDALSHELKADGSPVSEADREVEEALRRLVRSERPGDAFVGEEVGADGTARRRWIVDGIDGTIVYVHGGTGWGTEIALEVDGRVVVGVSTSPAMHRRWQAMDCAGATTTSGALAVSSARTLDGAVLTMIPPQENLGGERAALAQRLAARCRYVAPDTHGALMVAEGRADLCLQLDGGPWDYAALSVIVREAGGRFSDLAGEERIDGYGPALFSNGTCHDAALAALKQPGPTAP